MSFNYLQSEIKVMSTSLSAPDATSLPQEQAAKTSMVSEVLCTVEKCVANTFAYD